MNTTKYLTPDVLSFFDVIAKDAGNWNGTPLFGGNFADGPTEKGLLANLKKAKLVTTFRDEGLVWIEFTDDGKRLAAERGITV